MTDLEALTKTGQTLFHGLSEGFQYEGWVADYIGDAFELRSPTYAQKFRVASVAGGVLLERTLDLGDSRTEHWFTLAGWDSTVETITTYYKGGYRKSDTHDPVRPLDPATAEGLSIQLASILRGQKAPDSSSRVPQWLRTLLRKN